MLIILSLLRTGATDSTTRESDLVRQTEQLSWVWKVILELKGLGEKEMFQGTENLA